MLGVYSPGTANEKERGTNMSRTPSFLVTLACGATLALGFAANADACESQGKINIKVKVDSSGQPVVDPDTVSACVGDTVHWVFAGSKEFKVHFMDGDSPFDWSDSKGASVEGTVKADAVKGDAPTPYKYSVDVDGKVLDPKIIVDP
jgi:plastocyanin